MPIPPPEPKPALEHPETPSLAVGIPRLDARWERASRSPPRDRRPTCSSRSSRSSRSGSTSSRSSGPRSTLDMRPPMIVVDNYLDFILARNKGGAWGLLQRRARSSAVRSSSSSRRCDRLHRHALLAPPAAAARAQVGPAARPRRRARQRLRSHPLRVRHRLHRRATSRASGIEHHWPTFNVADIAICVGVGADGDRHAGRQESAEAQRDRATLRRTTRRRRPESPEPADAEAAKPCEARALQLFGVGFPSYFVLLLTGFLFATASGALWAKRIGRDPDVIVDLGLAMLLAGVVGSRILHVLADGYFWDYVHLCTDPGKRGLAARQGDVRLAPITTASGTRRRTVSPGQRRLLRVGEVLGGRAHVLRRLHRRVARRGLPAPARSLPVLEGRRHGGLRRSRSGSRSGAWAACSRAAASARAASCRGRSSFPPRSPASESQVKLHVLASTKRRGATAVHPTQIYESVASLAIAAVCLLVVHPRKRYDGQVFVAFLVLYAVARFLLEFLRRDDRGGLARSLDVAADRRRARGRRAVHAMLDRTFLARTSQLEHIMGA